MTKIRIPPVMRQQTSGAREIEVEGSTVGEVLQHLSNTYPPLQSQLFENGDLRRYVNVYVNDQDIQYLDRLETPVEPTDTVIILPAMAGGDGS